MRKLNGAHLEQLLKGANRLEWEELNAQVRDEEAGKFLEDFETAVEKFLKDLLLFRGWALSGSNLSLRAQLDRLKTADDITVRLERLAEYRLAIFGADYLFWECSQENGEYEDQWWSHVKYHSHNTVPLSVEPFGTQSRRAQISIGQAPPLIPPVTHGVATTVWVNDVELRILDDDIPF